MVPRIFIRVILDASMPRDSVQRAIKETMAQTKVSQLRAQNIEG